MNIIHHTAVHLFGWWSLVGIPAFATGAVMLVEGDNNPNLAGRADGYACCGGDSAPAQSPELLTGIETIPGMALTFSVTGSVSFVPGNDGSGNNPDGNSGVVNMSNFGNGLAAPLGVRWNSLLGVFLDDNDPTGMMTPVQLQFGGDLGFAAVAPGLRQIFFIGDGLTSDSKIGDFSGSTQLFIVPAGATRLFLGTADGTGWFNNSGDFDLKVAMTTVADTDDDGVVDPLDNCTDVANADQRDTDSDGIGSLCDADLDGSCVVNFVDLKLLKAVFFSDDADADLDGSGTVNFGDLNIMKAAFFGAPGPSGISNVCD